MNFTNVNEFVERPVNEPDRNNLNLARNQTKKRTMNTNNPW